MPARRIKWDYFQKPINRKLERGRERDFIADFMERKRPRDMGEALLISLIWCTVLYCTLISPLFQQLKCTLCIVYLTVIPCVSNKLHSWPE